ncbi:helix-turn-helix transcriptional regulator [Nannocystis sp.]|nr:helix-turn-helix transcriptional regulator [Nannocystis sp.]
MRVPTGRLRIVSAPQGEAAEAHEGPPSPGRYIREQRMRRGMSVEQLAIDTKIPRASIDALEEDRFTALPGPVFVKGFFRCCARSLSLDADVVMALLHEHERALQQVKSGRRDRHAPQLARPAAVHASSSAAAAPRGAVQAPMHALAATAAGGAVGGASGADAAPTPAPALFDLRGLAPLLERLRGATSLAANSRLLMWIAVALMVALIVATAFVMAGGSAPGLPQS